MYVSYCFYLNGKHNYALLKFVKLYAHNYQHASIQIIYKNYYTSMTQPRFSHGATTCNIYPLPKFSQVNPVLCIGDIAHLVER